MLPTMRIFSNNYGMEKNWEQRFSYWKSGSRVRYILMAKAVQRLNPPPPITLGK